MSRPQCVNVTYGNNPADSHTHTKRVGLLCGQHSGSCNTRKSVSDIALYKAQNRISIL
jgi:hypothetical protein